MYYLQEFKVWKGIDKENPVWADLGFVSDNFDNLASILELLTNNTKRKFRIIHE